MVHSGIDVHTNQSQICIVTEAGALLHQRIHTQRERFAAVFAERSKARLLIEASTESAWVAQGLEALGHEVIGEDPNYAPMYAQRSRRVKTEKRDAEA
jgi:transposase